MNFSIVSAGHNPVFIVSGKDVTRIDSTGSVLGWDPDDTWDVTAAVFSPGTSLVLYTDGLTEVRNHAGQEFGEEGLAALLGHGLTTDTTINNIVQHVKIFCGNEFPDDLTLFILKRIPC